MLAHLVERDIRIVEVRSSSLLHSTIFFCFVIMKLELKDISFEISEEGLKKKILSGISFVVGSGKFVVITGPNGSGKSTLAQIIMGIKQPTTGEIFLDGKKITKQDITKRAKSGIGFSFQRPVILKGITVSELLSVAGEDVVTNEDKTDCLKRVGLSPEEYLNREVSEKMSGGELKRIEIASVLMRNSDLMIFDEPEAGIDLWSLDDLIDIFKKLKKEKKTVIVISHQERILKVADEIIVLESGRIKKQGKSKMILPSIGRSK